MSLGEPNYTWVVGFHEWKRGFKVKTSSERFNVGKAGFVIDVYLDGNAEAHRGKIAAYARYAGSEKALEVEVFLEIVGVARWQSETRCRLGSTASSTTRTRVGTEDLAPTSAIAEGSVSTIRCSIVTSAAAGKSKAGPRRVVPKHVSSLPSMTQIARNARFSFGVAPIVYRYAMHRRRARRVRLSLKPTDREAYYDERSLLWDVAHEKSAGEVRALFERMGGLYNKLAQDWATRDGLIPQPWVDELKGSFESLQPRKWSRMRACIYDGLAGEAVPFARPGKSGLARYFAAVEETPLAAASIGQVHVARRYGSREAGDASKAIVKVIYPEIRKHLLADLSNARRVAHVVTWVLKLPMKGAIDAIMDEQCESFPRELDLRLEADNIRRARDLFDRHALDVDVPVVFDDLSSSSVLSQSFLRGRTFSSLDVASLSPADRARGVEIVTAIARAIGTTLFRDRWFHSDPRETSVCLSVCLHPGNLMWMDSGKPGLIDWGQCTSLTPEQLRTLCHVVLLLHTKSPSVIERALSATEINFNTQHLDLKLALLFYFFDSKRDIASFVDPKATDFLMDAIQHNPRIMPVMTDIPREVVFYGRVCSSLRKSFELLGADVSVIDLWRDEARAALKELNATKPDRTSTALLLLPENPVGLLYILDKAPDWVSAALGYVSAFGEALAESEDTSTEEDGTSCIRDQQQHNNSLVVVVPKRRRRGRRRSSTALNTVGIVTVSSILVAFLGPAILRGLVAFCILVLVESVACKTLLGESSLLRRALSFAPSAAAAVMASKKETPRLSR
ncbi:hypothetical protein CTAYLR_007570 [Chrysophaeum taylorii]|uniref:ABC1 atypical kinase-like domain-containing protein n=1 Tax=Chrysophaeum taylorii TaxID=2483200 RepID=A0AAD7XPI4_9STRA|nr:hypothetical protein CTAYLR_007570 [Chrysophaeum taylorii]